MLLFRIDKSCTIRLFARNSGPCSYSCVGFRTVRLPEFWKVSAFKSQELHLLGGLPIAQDVSYTIFMFVSRRRLLGSKHRLTTFQLLWPVASYLSIDVAIFCDRQVEKRVKNAVTICVFAKALNIYQYNGTVDNSCPTCNAPLPIRPARAYMAKSFVHHSVYGVHSTTQLLPMPSFEHFGSTIYTESAEKLACI